MHVIVFCFVDDRGTPRSLVAAVIVETCRRGMIVPYSVPVTILDLFRFYLMVCCFCQWELMLPFHAHCS